MRIPPRNAVSATVGLFLCATVLVFPQATPQPPKAAQKSKRARSGNHVVNSEIPAARTYRVRQGDTLSTIARTHGTSIGALKAANQLHTSRLKIGQRLLLPSSGHSGAKPAGTANSDLAAENTEAPTPAAAPPSETKADLISQGESLSPELPDMPPVSLTEEHTDAQSAGSPQPLRIRLATMGVGMLGVRYRWNGNSEVSGFDCSGLVKSLFDKFNISLPRSSREQYQVGEKVDKDKLEVGDLVFFSSRGKTPSHVGIYIGDNQFLHAARKARRVIISSLSANWYTKRFLGARRLADLWAEEPPPPSEEKPN